MICYVKELWRVSYNPESLGLVRFSQPDLRSFLLSNNVLAFFYPVFPHQILFLLSFPASQAHYFFSLLYALILVMFADSDSASGVSPSSLTNNGGLFYVSCYNLSL